MASDFLQAAEFLQEELKAFYEVRRQMSDGVAVQTAAQRLWEALQQVEPMAEDPGEQWRVLGESQRWGYLRLVSHVGTAMHELKPFPLPCILIAEEDRGCRNIFKRHLARGGVFRFLEAENGREALAIAAREPLDCLLLDLRIPQLAGLEVARRIRALPPPNGQVPILAVSAYPASEYEACARTAGCNVYIQKPILDFTSFCSTVIYWLTRGGVSCGVRRPISRKGEL